MIYPEKSFKLGLKWFLNKLKDYLLLSFFDLYGKISSGILLM